MMQLSRVEIRNYKSLRDVAIEPGPVTVLVGPNGAGKTNFVDALGFLGDVYRLGLEKAVSLRHGYENISYRHPLHSTAAIHFRVVLNDRLPDPGRDDFSDVRLEHEFAFGTDSRNGGASYVVTGESLRVYESAAKQEVLQINRTPETTRLQKFDDRSHLLTRLAGARQFARRLAQDVRSAELILPTSPLIQATSLSEIAAGLGSLRSFHLSPWNERQPGVMTPNPDLDYYGNNLPALIEYMKKQYPSHYRTLLDCVRQVMPSLELIQTSRTHKKTLALFIKEKEFDELWTADEISDGTLQTIGLLAAILDPRTKIVIIEEPENSLHTWALRTVVDAARVAAESKQIILTTHSPIVVNQLRPQELWVVQRPAGETRIDPLLKLEPSVKDDWDQGKFTLSEYLDSGAVPDAVPSVAS
jgi:predicted ATPase